MSWVNRAELVEAVRQTALGGACAPAARTTASALGLVDGSGLTETGRRLVEDGLLRRRESVVQDVLRESYLEQPSLRPLLDGEWGNEITRNQAEDILRYANLEMRDWKQSDFTRLFESLNFAGLLNFNRRRPTVRILAASPSTKLSSDGALLSPATPYRNKRLLADLVGSARQELSWYDAHFPREGLAFIYDHATLASLKRIRVLSAGRAEVRPVTLDDYTRLRAEFRTRGISLEWRTQLDKEEFTTKHDRWVLADDRLWNVPPFTAMSQNKFGSLLSDSASLPLEEWWDRGTDLSLV